MQISGRPHAHVEERDGAELCEEDAADHETTVQLQEELTGRQRRQLLHQRPVVAIGRLQLRLQRRPQHLRVGPGVEPDVPSLPIGAFLLPLGLISAAAPIILSPSSRPLASSAVPCRPRGKIRNCSAFRDGEPVSVQNVKDHRRIPLTPRDCPTSLSQRR